MRPIELTKMLELSHPYYIWLYADRKLLIKNIISNEVTQYTSVYTTQEKFIEDFKYHNAEMYI